MTFIINPGSLPALLCIMKGVVASVLFLVLGSYLNAQQEIQGPHNGHLMRVGYYNIEAVDCSGYLEIYLFDTEMNPMRNYGLSGVVDFHYPDATCATVKLFPYGIDGFTAEAEKQDYTGAEVFIRGKGLSLRAMFKELVCFRPNE